MALTNSGFDGTVTELAWANMSALTDVDAVESSAAWALTQGTGRQVSTAAQSGYAFAKGVLSEGIEPILTSLATPVNGQWFLMARHLDWSVSPANAVTIVAIAHSTTTTTVPTAPPSTYPTLDNSPGVVYDQKLGWAWVRSTDTTVTLFDLRILPPSATDLQAYKWVDSAQRNAQTGMRNGDTGYQSDNKTTFRYDSATWYVWERGRTAYTPTLAEMSLGSGAIEAYYSISSGFIITLEIAITWGANTSMSGPDFRIGAPGALTSTNVSFAAPLASHVVFRDVSANASWHGAADAYANMLRPRVFTLSGSGVTDNGPTGQPMMSFATGDFIAVSAVAHLAGPLTA
ncbi:hypothetical protein E3T43_12810 [Cryobacterium sp. Hh7]|uniref:hypothetical protein n=1 Tax=Cryobacterium sp. Hh7 TaxID=1259159 RepID=UPI00106C598A|nr:hypothetical protein [Cryobacterium sp. Hh7]TFD54212.1 hypothetical protein E3T43_12810 [Cryobacterium sp. Hh7]